MKKYFTKEVLIGLTVLVSLVILYCGIEFLKGVNVFTPSNFYYARFQSVEGLRNSSPVRVNGFAVGQVRDLKYDYNTNEIVAQINLDENLKVPEGSVAKLQSDLLGTATVVIELGSGSTFCKPGTELPSAKEGGLMDAVKEDMLPSVSAMLPKIDSILTSINTILANPAINASVTRLDAITADLAVSSHQLSLMMNKQIPGMMQNVNGITQNLNVVSGDLVEVTGKVKNMPLEESVNNLNTTIANIKDLTDNLKSKDSSLGLLLNDPKLYNSMNSAVASLDSLLNDVKANPKRYIHIKVF